MLPIETDKKRILLVEDEVSTRKIYETILSTLNHHVEVAANGQEAVSWCIRQDFDLVLMDINMPQMNGVDAIEAIKLCRPNMTIVILSGLSPDDALVQAGIEAGAMSILEKRTPMAVIINTITEILSTTSGHAE